MLLRPLLPLALGCLAWLAGCSEIIPGLNIRTGGGDHEYRVVPDAERNDYKIVNEGTETNYRIVPITGQTLKAAYEERADSSGWSLPAILPSDVPPEYRIGPGDIIYVTVWDHPELTSPYTAAVNDSSVQAVQGRLVASDGTIFYPYVGVFRAAGMTTPEVRTYLIEHLKRVIADPQIDVRVAAFRAKRVEVTGEVMKPGTLNLDDTPKGVLQAIAASGGLAPAASRRRAMLLRRGKAYEIDLAGLLSGERSVPNPEVIAGDILHIPDQTGDEIFVLGAVNKQQPFPIVQDSMPLIRALTDAGGLDNVRASQSGVLVFRMHETGPGKIEATVYTLDLSRPDGMLLASQFPLKPRDIVYVQATAFAQYNAVVNQLLPTVTTVFELRQLTR